MIIRCIGCTLKNLKYVLRYGAESEQYSQKRPLVDMYYEGIRKLVPTVSR